MDSTSLTSQTLFDPPPELISAIKGQESSGGKNKAVGKAGERGSMQIRPETAAQYGYSLADLDDPQKATAAGTRYLGDMLKRYKGNKFLALVAYNSGPGRVDKGQLLPQSVKYATRILQSMKKPEAQPQPGAQPTGEEMMTPGTPLPSWTTPLAPIPPGGERVYPRPPHPPRLMGPGAEMESAPRSPEDMPVGPRDMGGPSPAMPSFTSQQGMMEPHQIEEIPSHGLFGRIGSAVGGALEGTAHAEELPPLPSGLKPTMGAEEAPSEQPSPTEPPLPPLPSGQQPIAEQPQQWKPTISFGPSGPRMSMTVVEPSQQERQQLDQNLQVLNQLKNTEEAMRDVQKHPEYWSARNQNAQYLQYFHSRIAKNLSSMGMVGATPPAEVAKLFTALGNLQAMMARGYMGGRVGVKLLERLGPHIPKADDSLEATEQRLTDLPPMLESSFKILRVAQSNPDAALQMIDQAFPPEGATGGRPESAVPQPPPGFK